MSFSMRDEPEAGACFQHNETQEERTLGFAKQSSDYDDRARTVGGLMTSKGAHVGFINQNKLAEYLSKGGEIIYDSDGLYFI
jgi:hypothetical protein